MMYWQGLLIFCRCGMRQGAYDRETAVFAMVCWVGNSQSRS